MSTNRKIAKVTSRIKKKINKNVISYIIISLHNFLLFVAVPDNRCFLEDGGSAESFFVSEDVPIGTVIGEYIKDNEKRLLYFPGPNSLKNISIELSQNLGKRTYISKLALYHCAEFLILNNKKEKNIFHQLLMKSLFHHWPV